MFASIAARVLMVLPGFSAVKLYLIGGALALGLLALGTWSIKNRIADWQEDRAKRSAIETALDHSREILRRQTALATQRKLDADAASANIEQLQGMLANAAIASPDLARCVTPHERVRLLRAVIVAGDRRKGGAAAAAAR